MQVVIQPPSLIETGIKVETVNNRPLFKFTDRLQLHLETLLQKNKFNDLTVEEQDELTAINELDRLFTYLNSLLLTVYSTHSQKLIQLIFQLWGCH